MFCVLLGPAGRTAMFFCGPFFFFFSIFGGPANLCDSVATECLPAAESEALQQPSSPQPTARSLDASLRTPTDSLLPPQPRAALSELAHLYSIYYYCCARVCPQQPPPSLSCKDHFIQRRRCLTFFFFFFFLLVALMDLPSCISLVFTLFVFCRGEARWCCRWWCRWWLCSNNNAFYGFLIIGLYAVLSFSPAPLSDSEAAAGYSSARQHTQTHTRNTSDLSNWQVCRGCVVPPPPHCLIPNPLVFDRPHSHWCFMFNSGSTQLHLEPPQLTAAFHFYAKTGGLRSQPPTRSYI